ncbi:MAG: hypothetical protein HC902_12995, partial [Calothrix sp. SM1_5_4]|nr:hypothetical protein [Calothrix sp. SM1_5_4]
MAPQAGGLAGVFSNITMTGESSCNITPSAGNHRIVRVSVKPAGSGAYTTLSPDTVITSVPGALVAETLQGYSPASFLKVRLDGSTSLNQFNLEEAFNSTNWPRLRSLLDGDSSQYMVSNPTAAVGFNSQRLSNVADPTSAQDAATKHYSDS